MRVRKLRVLVALAVLGLSLWAVPVPPASAATAVVSGAGVAVALQPASYAFSSATAAVCGVVLIGVAAITRTQRRRRYGSNLYTGGQCNESVLVTSLPLTRFGNFNNSRLRRQCAAFFCGAVPDVPDVGMTRAGLFAIQVAR